MLIDLTKPSKLFVYTNSKLGFNKTGRQGVIVYLWNDNQQKPLMQMVRAFGFDSTGQVGIHVPCYDVAIHSENKSLEMLGGPGETELRKLGLQAIEAVRVLGVKAWNMTYAVDPQTWTAKVVDKEKEKEKQPKTEAAA